MDAKLKQDIERMFSVFHDNTLMDLHQLLPPVPAAKQYQIELEHELADFRKALIDRLELEFRF